MKLEEWWANNARRIEKITKGLELEMYEETFKLFKSCHAAGVQEGQRMGSKKSDRGDANPKPNEIKIKFDTGINYDENLMKIFHGILVKATKEAQLELREHGICIEHLRNRCENISHTDKLDEKPSKNHPENNE